MSDSAPVVLFVYNRPKHTAMALENLAKCSGADQCRLIIYSDAAKSSDLEHLVKEVRSVISEANGFKQVEVRAASGYVGYLKDYILPYIELKITGLITFLSWLIPPMQNGPASVDAYFQSGQFHWGALGPALAQTAVLAVIWFLTKKGED